MTPWYRARLKSLVEDYRKTVETPNEVDPSWTCGWFDRFKRPVLSDRHVPLTWRYDLSPTKNPHLMERLGINAAFNAGAIEHDGKIYVMARVEGHDRKSFFGLTVSDDGVNNFRFVGGPIVMPQTDVPETNIYDMRLTKHEDGWIYGIFCAERKDPDAPAGDLSSAVAQCGVARTRNLVDWERLKDIKTPSPQQRNVVLHPEFVDGKYAFYTRPQDGFISAGTGGGIGWGLSESIEEVNIPKEAIIDQRAYHTIKESKNGAGDLIKTDRGWLHIAHGVRGCAAGLRYVLYAFLCDLDDPSKVIAAPGGFFLAPYGEERVGDVSNVAFCNGVVHKADGEVLIYYASSDTRLHVARTDVDRLLDYVINTPPDAMNSHDCAKQRRALYEGNLSIIDASDDPLVQSLRGL